MKNKCFGAIILIALLNASLMADAGNFDSRSRHYFFNFSLFYPLSINQSKYDSTNVNLSLVYGHVGKVHGLDLALGFSLVENEIRGIQLTGIGGVSGEDFAGGQIAGFFNAAGERFSGIQISGLFNVCGEDFTGWQSSGLFNVAGDNSLGIQTSGFMNVVGDSFMGWQSSGFMNVVGNEFRGIQLTGIINVVGESSQGLQASGLFNISGESFLGVQFAGGFNITGEEHFGLQAAGGFSIVGGRIKGAQVSGLFNFVGNQLSGLQLGTVNLATSSKGAQLGTINIAGEMNGFQLGLVNYSEKTGGLPVGLVNVSKYEGRIRWINWASNISGINSGVRFKIRNIYSIVALGVINLYEDIKSSLSYSGFYGVSFPLDRLSLNTDIGYTYMDNKDLFRSRKGEIDQHAAMLRASLNWDLSGGLSLFAGGGLSYIKDNSVPSGTGNARPLFFFGLELF